MREKLLRATCIFTKIKLQIIASLLYKISAHFRQYFGYLSPISEDQKKKGFRRKSVLISVRITGILSQKVGEDQKKKRFQENQTEEGFSLDLFICQKENAK